MFALTVVVAGAGRDHRTRPARPAGRRRPRRPRARRLDWASASAATGWSPSWSAARWAACAGAMNVMVRTTSARPTSASRLIVLALTMIIVGGSRSWMGAADRRGHLHLAARPARDRRRVAGPRSTASIVAVAAICAAARPVRRAASTAPSWVQRLHAGAPAGPAPPGPAEDEAAGSRRREPPTPEPLGRVAQSTTAEASRDRRPQRAARPRPSVRRRCWRRATSPCTSAGSRPSTACRSASTPGLIYGIIGPERLRARARCSARSPG